MAARDNLHPVQMGLFNVEPYEKPVLREPEVSPELQEHRDFSATAPMHIRVPTSVIPKIAKEGFKTQHETGFSSGNYDPEWRAEFEDKAFGKGARPVYGYFTHGDVRDAGRGSYEESPDPDAENVEQYGPTALRLKESVRAHTTYTPGDSLGKDAAQVGKPGQVVPGTKSPWNYDTGYTEMQVHKPITMRDVQSAIHYREPQSTSWADTPERSEHARRYAEAEDLYESDFKGHMRDLGIPHEVRTLNTLQQPPLPLSTKDWGDANMPYPVTGRQGLTKEWTESATVSRWSPTVGEFPPGKGGVVSHDQFYKDRDYQPKPTFRPDLVDEPG